MDIDKINKLENIYDKSKQIFDIIDSNVQEFMDNEKDVDILLDYYFNGSWKDDYEYSNNNEINIKAGILSEDLIYNHYIERKELAIKLIEIGLEILKK